MSFSPCIAGPEVMPEQLHRRGFLGRLAVILPATALATAAMPPDCEIMALVGPEGTIGAFTPALNKPTQLWAARQGRAAR